MERISGWIDNTDISATIINQGFTHARLSGEVVADGMTPGIIPDMPETANPGDVIQIPLWLGSMEEGVENVQGFSFDIAIDAAKLDMSTLTLDYSGSPLGNLGADYFTNANIDAGNGLVSMVFTRNGLFPFSGYGVICTLRIQVRPEAPIDSYAVMTVGNVIAVDGTLNTFMLGSGEAQVLIVQEVIFGISTFTPQLVPLPKIYPNPTDASIFIEWTLPQHLQHEWITLTLFNVLGQQVLEKIIPFHPESYRLDIKALPIGVYFLQLNCQTVQANVKLMNRFNKKCPVHYIQGIF